MSQTELLLVHGYNHDPSDYLGEHSPHRPGGNFDVWPRIFSETTPLFLPWYSAVQWRDTRLAWDAGFSTTYGWAYGPLVDNAVEQLLTRMHGKSGIDCFAHSLGTRVALLAAEQRPDLFRKIILINGAEIWRVANPIIENTPGIQYLNIAVAEDDVLARAGSLMAPGDGVKRCIGNGCPPGMRWLENFNEVRLDDEYDQRYWKALRDWDLEGDGPSRGDHSFSYDHEGNHELYRSFFADTL